MNSCSTPVQGFSRREEYQRDERLSRQSPVREQFTTYWCIDLTKSYAVAL